MLLSCGFNFYRATHYSAKRSIAIAYRPYVGLSVVCDVGASGAHRLEILGTNRIIIARTISPTPSLFLAQRPPRYSQGNVGVKRESRGGVGKSGVLKHKSSNIFETRKGKGKVTMEAL